MLLTVIICLVNGISVLTIGFAIGVNYIILEGQLVLCYRFLSKNNTILNSYSRSIIKVSYQLSRSQSLILINYY